MRTDTEWAEWLARLDTAGLQRGDEPTRALVVFNNGDAPYSGLARFTAAFPVRAEAGASPVIVRDATGMVVPSRLIVSELSPDASLPPGRLWWRMELEFYALAVPPNGYRAYAAVFGFSPLSRSGQTAFWGPAPPPPETIFVRETECHAGDLPLSGVG